MLDLLGSALSQTLNLLVAHAVEITVTGGLAALGAFWRERAARARAHVADAKSTTRADLAAFAVRSADQLLNVILADPAAAAAIEAAKARLVAEMTAAARHSLTIIGAKGDAAGVERLILGAASRALPGRVATAGVDGEASPSVQAAAAALARASGLLP